jgi:hypothetical protein
MVAQREGNKDAAPFARFTYGDKSLLVLRVGGMGEKRRRWVKCGFKGINRNAVLLALATIALIPFKPFDPLCNETGKVRPSRSICDKFSLKASETRSPCRNISRNRQRSRASCRAPWVAAISFSISPPVRCFLSSLFFTPYNLKVCNLSKKLIYKK